MRSSAAAFAAAALLGSAAGAIGQTPHEKLVSLVREDCGSCHGITLKGGLGSPLLPAALANKDAKMLTAIILDGVPGTPMPPWRGLLSPEDARWIAENLKEGFPK